MTITTAQDELTALEEDQLSPLQIEKLLNLLPTYFSLEKINPLWPQKDVLMNHLLKEEDENNNPSYRWEEWKQIIVDWIAKPELLSDGWFSATTKLLGGVVNLPEDVLNAAYKRLFGEFTKQPSFRAICLIGFALFNPKEFFFDYVFLGFDQQWPKLVEVANKQYLQQRKARAALEDLLQELE